jgi:hypothetical protein
MGILEAIVYGFIQGIGRCDRTATPITISEAIGNDVVMYVEPLTSGNYQYQVFMKRLSTNQEFSVLDGRIEVSNRLGTATVSNAPQSAVVDVALFADTIEVNVTVQEGTKGEQGIQGIQGIKGDKGDQGIQGIQGIQGVQGEKGDKGTVDYTLVCDVVKVKPQGTSEDNYISYGFTFKVSKAGVIGGLHIKDRTSGSVATNQPIYVKVWNSNNTLLAKSLNAVEHSISSTLSYEFEPFTVAENEVLKVTFHTKDGMAQNTYQVGVQTCTRVVTLIEGEEGGMLTSQGGYGTTTYTAVHEWDYLERKFATIEELNTHIGSDTHLTDEQKTLLEQVANGEIGGGGSTSIDWLEHEGTVITIGNNISGTANAYAVIIGDDASCSTWDSSPANYNVVIGNYAGSGGMYNVTIGHGSRTNNGDSTCIGYNSGSDNVGVTVGCYSWGSVGSAVVGASANASEYCTAIGYCTTAYGNSTAIGYNATSNDSEIVLRGGSTELKVTSNGIELNGEPYGGGSGGSGGSEYDVRKAVLMSVHYDTKYSGIDMYQHRNSCYNEWVEKEVNGDYYSGTWYEYYNDLTPSGEWLYSFNCSDCTYVFYDCPWITKFAAKIENNDNIAESFCNCNELESFYTPSKLRSTQNTFSGCTKLKEFYADLSELNNASYMFGSDSYNCTCLNVESVEHIANSIGTNGGDFYIGMAYELQNDYGDGKYQRCQDALQKIRDKGWTVYEMYSEYN